MTQGSEIGIVPASHMSGGPVQNSSAVLTPGVGFSQVAPGLALGANINIASLYVGELKLDVSEQLLWNIFTQFGQVLSVKVCRDSQTHISLGYAYVNFRSTQEAEKALENVNFTTIDGKPCRVMWSMRDSTRRKFGIGNLFIKNIDLNLDAKSLYQAFSSFGTVLSCKIALDEYGLSKGYGFIQFLNEIDAEHARERSNGVRFSNKPLVVNKFVPRAERKDAKPIDPNEFTNVFVKNFGKEWTEGQMKAKFEKFGDITSLLIRKNDNEESLGYGFVNFAKHEFAANAIKEMNGTTADSGSVLTVCRAMKLRERKAFLRRQYEERKLENFKKYQNLNLYIKNFDDTVTDTKLQEMFQEFGEIKSAHVMKDEGNRSRCFGFVCFNKPEEATKAIELMHLKVIDGRPLYVAHAQSKEERRKIFEQQTYNNSFRGPLIAPPSGVQFVYPPPGSFPYAPQPQFPRFQQPQMPNRNQQRGVQQGSSQPGQQYVQNVQRSYNYQQDRVGSYQGNYRGRNNAGGGMGRSNQGSYPQRQHQNQNPQVQVSVNQVASENAAPRPKRDEHKIQPQPKSTPPDHRMEFNNKIYQVCQNLFKQMNFDDSYLTRISGIVIDYFNNDSNAHLTTKESDIVDAARNAYECMLADNRVKA